MIYGKGTILKCIEVTLDNAEQLELDRLYRVEGMSIIEGYVVYAVMDSDEMIHYAIADRFEPTGWRYLPKHETLSLPLDRATIQKPKTDVDMVNQPPHYTDGGIETIDYLKAKLPPEGFRGFLQGNVLKYVSRAGKKSNTVEDYKKAKWYLEKLISTFSEEDEVVTLDELGTEDINPITSRQNGYITGLTNKLGIDHRDMPDWLSPLPDSHDLTEGEASVVIDRLLLITNYRKEKEGQ